MSEFTDVMRQARRMCKAQEDCESCPLWNTANFFCKLDTTCYSDDNVIESIIMQWAAEHPEHPEPSYPTWREWQNSTFPYADRDICPCEFGRSDRFNCDDKTCAECLLEQIPADIAEKLGIKPKEVK